MRRSVSALAALVLVLLVGCGKKSLPPGPPVAPRTPPPAPAPAATSEPTPAMDDYDRLRAMSVEDLARMNLLPEIRFDFDKSDVRADARVVLARNADTLRRFDFLRVTIEGHCDERGTIDYNLALGERRARAALDYLVSLGVPAERLGTVSHGKETPACPESTEACWAQNRRARFVVTGNAGLISSMP